MLVRDVLASKGSDAVFTIAPDATVAELLDMLADHNIGALVVSEDGTTIIGIVSERDIVRTMRTAHDVRSLPVSQIMTSDLHTCSPLDSFGALMVTMTEQRIRHVPVVEDGSLVGVLSIGDAVKHRMGQLEFERDQLNSYVSGG